jgi:hypothetical protein
MSSSLFLIFNHQFTSKQESDARSSLGVSNIINMPGDLQELWSNIPPELPKINSYLEPIRRWLTSRAKRGDYVLVQGDFGACYLMVEFSLEKGLDPVYSTTGREVLEELGPNGSVKLTHHFQHRIFRRYGR